VFVDSEFEEINRLNNRLLDENAMPCEQADHPLDPTMEIKRLQRCMSDLIGVLALPAAWRGREPIEILSSLVDSQMEMLALDFFYARVILGAGEKPLGALRASPSHRTDEIAQSIRDWLNENRVDRPSQAQRKIGDEEISIFQLQMGVECSLGFIVAGSRRVGFPEQTERLVLNVAVNQTAATLQQALLLSKQKRIASELDRRVAERTRELAESSAEFQLQVGLLQHLPVSAWTLKPDGTPDFVNRVWLEYAGQTLDFVRSHPEAWMTAVHPEDREAASRVFWEGVRSGHGFAIETRSLRAQDGTYRWHLQQAVPLRDADGKILKFVGTTTDIDDRKRAEEELRASETNLRQIVDSIPGLACALGPSGQIELPNQPLMEYFGKTAEELNAWGSNDAVHPDDLPRVTAEVTHSFTTGTPYDSELRYRRADGVYRWFQCRILPVRDTEGRITRWYGLLTDIEDRKRAEDALRASENNFRQIVDNIPGLVATLSPSGEIELVNQQYLDYFRKSLDEIKSWRVNDVLHPDDLHRMEAAFAHAMTKETALIEEFRYRRADGVFRWFHARVFPMLDPDGRLARWYVLAADIDDWKKAQEELRNTQAELARMMRVMTIGQLTASIAHEVSQPLSGIIMNASTCLRMLKSDPPDIDGARETAQRTIRDSNRASEVITRLRTLFSKKRTNVEPLDLNEAAREVVALLSGELERNNVVLKHEFSDQLPAVHGDRVQLQQVILNLLRNASDAMSGIEDRPRQMVLRTKLEGEHVRLSVQDSGVGFTPEVANQMFESFYTTKSDGMGVGLSVSRSIIEANRGRLWATANDGPGATFAFSIPCESVPHPHHGQ
jgi:PAS domain S-box-containing protein